MRTNATKLAQWIQTGASLPVGHLSARTAQADAFDAHIMYNDASYGSEERRGEAQSLVHAVFEKQKEAITLQLAFGAS